MSGGFALFAAFMLIITLGPAVGLVLGGIGVSRRARVSERVAVDAVVVEYSNWSTPRRVTFDYPAPNGQWLRARKVEGFSSVQRSGYLVNPGDRVTVYVDPANPIDVRLSPGGSAAGLLGPFMVAGGVALALFGVVMVISAASLMS